MSNKTLFTKYSEKMDKELPHSYYPRPQFKRNSFLCLNGEWDFAVNKTALSSEYEEKILVPFPPESALSGIERIIQKDEYIHYRRTFSLPKGFVRDRVILHFGAVDAIADVYVNGKNVGRNEGGYIPFCFDITELINDENTLEVHVKDGIDKAYPYGKQRYDRGGMWYTPVSGIWQSVWIESVPKNAVSSIKITPSESSVKITVYGGEEQKRITLTDSHITYDFVGDSIVIAPPEPITWSPKRPYLYYFTLECGEDIIESYFALRSIDIRNISGRERICLNGKPYLFNGLLDQGYWPDGIFVPGSIDGYIDDILLAKSLGFNMLRKHIKIEPMIFYYLCDKEGIAVFQDMVNNSDYSFIRDTALPTIGLQKLPDKHLHTDPVSRKNFTDAMHKTCELLYNSPSVVYYTIFNEGWGQFLADDMYKLLKKIDETRIVDATSGWFRRGLSDVNSRHIYFKRLRPKGVKSDKRPLCISEFGGYSYRVEGHVFGKDNYGYRIYSEKGEFEQAIISLYENEVMPLIEQGACAFVYTQLSDVEDETNGFITYDRRQLKVDKERIYSVMNKIFKN